MLPTLSIILSSKPHPSPLSLSLSLSLSLWGFHRSLTVFSLQHVVAETTASMKMTCHYIYNMILFLVLLIISFCSKLDADKITLSIYRSKKVSDIKWQICIQEYDITDVLANIWWSIFYTSIKEIFISKVMIIWWLA